MPTNQDQIKPLIASLVRDGEVVHILPTLDFVLGLPTGIRAAIYTELAKVPTNEYHVDPVLIFGTSVEEWYRTSKLRPELIQKINQRFQLCAWRDHRLQRHPGPAELCPVGLRGTPDLQGLHAHAISDDPPPAR